MSNAMNALDPNEAQIVRDPRAQNLEIEEILIDELPAFSLALKQGCSGCGDGGPSEFG
jgi:hypothetical protein